MSCTDCFNGCAGTTPDKCVKYTGVNVPELNIEKGDSLFSVEDNIILKILSMAIGDGILPEIPVEDICALIQANLPLVGPYTLNDYISAISKAVCNNTTSIQTINNELTELHADYDLNCIVVDPQDIGNTHVILQAVLDYACQLKIELDALALTVSTNYVAIADLDGYIAAYLATTAPSNLISNKMIPFVAVEYYGTLANFNGAGAGIGLWDKVYLCNGANGTPDKRGVAPVGVTNVLGGGAYNPKVDPAISGNPTYTLGNVITGTNTVTLTALQIPPHTHTATVLLVDPGHVHPNSTENPSNGSGSTYNYDSVGDKEHFGLMNTQTATTGITVTVTNSSTGGGDAHSNIQPVLPCYYIMYIP